MDNEINFTDGNIRSNGRNSLKEKVEKKLKIIVSDYLQHDMKSIISQHTPYVNISEEVAINIFDQLIINSLRSLKRGHIYRVDLWDEDEGVEYICQSIWIVGSR